MFAYQIDIYEKQNNSWGWHTLSGWSRPFTDGTRLDETLDSGSLNLIAVERSKPIKPFTRLRIIVSENNEEKERIYRVVASTRRTRRSYTSPVLYDWLINTVEITKLLERRLIDTLTVTKYLSSEKSSVQYKAPQVLDKSVSNSDFEAHARTDNFYGLKYMTPYLLGATIDIYNPKRIIGFTDYSINSFNENPYVEIISPSNQVTTFTVSDPNNNNDNVIATYTLSENGTYQIRTRLDVALRRSAFDTLRAYGTFVFYVSAYSHEIMPTQPTITSVCERLLSAGITRRKGVEIQEFLLDPNFAEEYEDVLSPEFSFTNSTLFEALLQVGGFIHAIPRLIPRSTSDDTHYYVTFDKLGGDEESPELPPMIYSEQTIDVNDWVGQIDTPAQNLVNTEDVTNGAITELGNAYITVRTEEGQVEINGDNVLIRTTKPIHQIVKVECSYLNGGTLVNVGDITAYVYESAEYQTLSSYWGSAYPYSKAWALYYSQGGNTIDGLTFRWKDQTSDQTAFANYAIANIINAVTGSSLTWSDTASGEFMRKLAFRVTYVPIAQARVKAHKPSLAEGGAVNNALTYNQGANVAETSFYGEKMRGAIARLGHDVETRTYDIFNYYQLPKIGQLLDGKYIAHIDYEWDITKVRITLALTKDFNMLSQFVGLNSNYRLYDISEKQSVERNVNYDELVVFGDRPNVNMSRYLMVTNSGGASGLMKAMLGQINPRGKILVARLTPYDENSQEIVNRAVILPVVAFPFGTSIALNVSYFDNYGAGYQQSDKYDSEVNKAVQRLVPYTDSFGEIKYLKASFNYVAWDSTASDQDDNGKAMLYPELTTPDNTMIGVLTGDNYFDIQKDSREILNLTYQLHFVSTRPSIVLSSGLSRYSDLVSTTAFTNELGQPKKTMIVWMKRKINGLNKYIEPRGDEPFVEYTNVANEIGDSYVFNAGTCPIDDCKAYAVCKTSAAGSAYRVPANVSAYADASLTNYVGTLTHSIIADAVDGNNNVVYAENVDVSNYQHIVQERGEGSLRVVTIALTDAPNQSTFAVYYIPTSISGDGDDWLPVASDKWSYDITNNAVTIDQNGRDFKVEYDTLPTITNTNVYVAMSSATEISIPATFELLFGENVELEQGETASTIYMTAALQQACNQDYVERLKFFGYQGTQRNFYYLYDEQNNEMNSAYTLEEPWICDPNKVFILHRTGFVDMPYYIIENYTDSHISTPTTVYINKAGSKIVTAYDLD